MYTDIHVYMSAYKHPIEALYMGLREAQMAACGQLALESPKTVAVSGCLVYRV